MSHLPNVLAPALCHRILVVGTSGCGKTTLAEQLAGKLGLAHIELDALHWEPGWRPATPAVFRQRANTALSCERWVVDGNYSEVRDIILSRADTLVWLDYSLPLIMWRLTWRTFQRVGTGKVLWNSNRERPLRDHFFSRKSIFLWALQTHPLRRQEYTALLANPKHDHLQVVRLGSPRDTRLWLQALN